LPPTEKKGEITLYLLEGGKGRKTHSFLSEGGKSILLFSYAEGPEDPLRHRHMVREKRGEGEKIFSTAAPKGGRKGERGSNPSSEKEGKENPLTPSFIAAGEEQKEASHDSEEGEEKKKGRNRGILQSLLSRGPSAAV